LRNQVTALYLYHISLETCFLTGKYEEMPEQVKENYQSFFKSII